MKVFPVRYRRRDYEHEGTLFIVAQDPERAREIAFSCLANNPAKFPERPASYGKIIADVWVMDSWAAETRSTKEGLIGSGSELLLAKALALYVERYNSLS